MGRIRAPCEDKRRFRKAILYEETPDTANRQTRCARCIQEFKQPTDQWSPHEIHACILAWINFKSQSNYKERIMNLR